MGLLTRNTIFGGSALLLAMAGTSVSAQNSATLGATADIQNSCTISAQDLDFGSLDTQTITQKDATATVTVQCVSFTVFELSMGVGNYNSGGQRRMSNGTDFIDYEVFKDSARTQPWGTSVLDTRWGVIALPGTTQDLEAYGRVTGLSPATAVGSFSDQLEIIVYF